MKALIKWRICSLSSSLPNFFSSFANSFKQFDNTLKFYILFFILTSKSAFDCFRFVFKILYFSPFRLFKLCRCLAFGTHDFCFDVWKFFDLFVCFFGVIYFDVLFKWMELFIFWLWWMVFLWRSRWDWSEMLVLSLFSDFICLLKL